MLLSELIEHLEYLKNQHGDITVCLEKDGGSYWGSYIEELTTAQVIVEEPYSEEIDMSIGHPGAPREIKKIKGNILLIKKETF